jgi:LPS export ABC transporter permease LptG/LPS export ABC transporter permease LptF
MGIIDRYVIRLSLTPLLLGLLVFTFLIIVPALMEYAEPLIAKGVAAPVVLRLMAMLVPHGLALAIPMSLLLGLLIAFGRLSSDREFVALQACGVRLLRLLRPVAILSAICWAATLYVMLVSVPAANQAFREIAFNIIAQRAEGDVKPRVFFDGFPNLVLYVRDIPPSGTGWQGVFLADERPGHPAATYFARRGRILIDRPARTVEVVLEDGSRHIAADDGKYEVFRFEDHLVLRVDAESFFPGDGPSKDINEMTVAELRNRITEMESIGLPTHAAAIAIHRKFAIPVACLVFGLIGLALGASNRRDSTLGSFVLGLVVIFLYYVPLDFGPAMAKGGLVPPWLAAWLPNIILGAVGVALLVWRDRVEEGRRGFALPSLLRTRSGAGSRPRAVRLPTVSILDGYVAQAFARIFVLSALATASIFYISTFIDLSDKVFRGVGTWAMLAEYFWYATPQFAYYVLPISVLLAAIVTIARLTKSSELIVMKACGISLYRIALPLAIGAGVTGLFLFALQETVLGPANRRAEAIRHVLRGGSPDTFDVLERRWVAGDGGAIYHYQHFNPRTQQLTGLSIYEIDSSLRGLTSRTFAARAVYAGRQPGGADDTWDVEDGWTRDFDAENQPSRFAAFERTKRPVESVAYFETEPPDAKFMSYAQLRTHTERLQASGFDVLEHQVALARKVAFPFATLVMTLIAVPFAVTAGRSGALAGIGVGIALALSYWSTLSVFAAFGAGGLIEPRLAAWAPNLLFSAGAAYLLLTVRT